jgi:hypothetical protein
MQRVVVGALLSQRNPPPPERCVDQLPASESPG